MEFLILDIMVMIMKLFNKMTRENIGVRCAYYLSVEEKSLRGDILDEQDKLCLICKGVDSKNCNLYYSIHELENFKKLFYRVK